jgi:hypothetical protein
MNENSYHNNIFTIGMMTPVPTGMVSSVPGTVKALPHPRVVKNVGFIRSPSVITWSKAL